MWSKLDKFDLAGIMSSIPEECSSVWELLTTNPKLMLAGGFIRSCLMNEPIGDIDIFGDELSIEKGKEFLQKKYGDPDPISSSKSTIFNGKIQLYQQDYFTTPEELLQDFDFTICQAVVWSSAGALTWESLCSPRYYRDLLKKELHYLGQTPASSIYRALKFGRLGYKMSARYLPKMFEQLLKQKSWESFNHLTVNEYIAQVLLQHGSDDELIRELMETENG